MDHHLPFVLLLCLLWAAQGQGQNYTRLHLSRLPFNLFDQVSHVKYPLTFPKAELLQKLPRARDCRQRSPPRRLLCEVFLTTIKQKLPRELNSNRVKRDFFDESNPVSSSKSSNWGDDFLRMLPIIGNSLLAKDESLILKNERLLHEELMLVKHFVYNNSLLTGSAFANMSHSLVGQEKDFVQWAEDRHLFSALQEFVKGLFLAAEGRLSPELIKLSELQSVRRKIKSKCDKNNRILL